MSDATRRIVEIWGEARDEVIAADLNYRRRYRHYRSGEGYRLRSWTIDRDSGAVLIHYQRCDGPIFNVSGPVWTRSLADFFADVEHEGKTVKRFRMIGGGD